MQTVKFGKTGMEITVIGFGSWTVGAAEFRLSEDEPNRIEAFLRENP